MAIAFVQSTGRVSGSAVESVTLTLPQRPAAGNFLAVVGAVWQGDLVNIDPANCSDSGGNAYAILQSPVQNGSRAYILYTQGVATIGAGSFSITVDPDGATYNEQVGVEFSGLATSGALDQTGTANLGTQTPSVSTAGATTQADELVLAALSVSEAQPNVGIDTPATPGYTNLGVNQDANATIGMSADYKIVAATGVQSAAWGSLNAPSNWAAAIATFKAAAGGGSDTILTPAAGLLSMSSRAALASLALEPGRGLLNISGKLPSTDLSMLVSRTGLVLSGKNPTVASDTGLSAATGMLVLGAKTVLLSQALIVAKGLMNVVGRSVTIVGLLIAHAYRKLMGVGM